MAPGPIRVLIVDDSSLVCGLLARNLGGLDDVEVVGTAESTDECLALMRALEPDVVTLDIRMPGESGLVALERIKRLPNPPMVVMLTNYAFSAYRRRCLELGADHFFDKTTEIHELVKLLRDRAGEDASDGDGPRERSEGEEGG